MTRTLMKIVMGVIGVGLAIAFLLVPVFKLKDLAMAVVILIGIAAMIYNLIEVVREKDEQ